MEDFTPEEHKQVNGIAHFMARRCGPFVDFEDLRQEGYIGLIAAKRKYDPTRGMLEKSYRGFVIRQKIIDSIRAFDLFGRAKPVEQMTIIPIEDPDEDFYYDQMIDKLSVENNVEADAYENELCEMVRQEIRSLPKRLRLAVHLYYYEDCMMKEIGEIIGVNESRASQLLAEARGILRKRLARCAA